jgi:low affinity Fe/Cu permease
MREAFRKLSERASLVVESPWSFLLAAGVVLTWLVTGPFFGFSEAWHLTMDSFTAAVTFLMVFLIQNTQGRDARAIQLKLNELLRVAEGAHPALVDLESLSEEEMDRLEQAFRQHRERRAARGEDVEGAVRAVHGHPPPAAGPGRPPGGT